MIFKASMDNLAKGVTLVVTLLFLALIIGQFTIFNEVGIIGSVIIVGLLVAIYSITFLLHPVNYRVETNEIIIHRPLNDIRINKDNIKSVQILEEGVLRWSVRTFGVGGLFGYFGKFANSKLGNMTWYATRRNNAVLVQTTDKKIIITPNEPEKFVQALEDKNTH